MGTSERTIVVVPEIVQSLQSRSNRFDSVIYIRSFMLRSHVEWPEEALCDHQPWSKRSDENHERTSSGLKFDRDHETAIVEVGQGVLEELPS